MRVFVILDDRMSLEDPLGEAVDVLPHPEGCRSRHRGGGDDPELTSYVRIEERELEAGGPN